MKYGGLIKVLRLTLTRRGMPYAKGKRANLVNLGLLKPKKASSSSIHNKENRPERFPFFSFNNILADFPAGHRVLPEEIMNELDNKGIV
jgi:hypothetical protein